MFISCKIAHISEETDSDRLKRYYIKHENFTYSILKTKIVKILPKTFGCFYSKFLVKLAQKKIGKFW